MEPNYYVSSSPDSSESGGFTRNQKYIGAGLAAAVLLGIIFTFLSGGNNISSQTQHLTLRMSNLQGILADTSTTRTLKNADLSKLVTELGINFDSDINTLKPLLVEAGLPQKFDKNIVAAEADTSTAQKIEDAKLNNDIDRQYAQIIQTKIAALRPLIAEIYSLTNNAALQKALSDTDKHLSDSLKQLVAIKL